MHFAKAKYLRRSQRYEINCVQKQILFAFCQGEVLETTLKNRKKPGRKQVYLHFVGSKRLRRSQRLGKCRTEIQIYLYFDGAVRGSCPHGYFRLSNGRVDGIRSCRRWLRRLQTDGKQGRLSVNGGRMRFTAAPLRNRERSVRVPCRPLLGRIPT